MQTTKFQYIFIALLLVAIVGAVFIFSRSRGTVAPLAHITIWGTLPYGEFSSYTQLASQNNPDLSITYVQKSPDTFDQEFVEALASGVGPDVVLLPQDLLLRHQDKIYPIPYTSLTERTFKDTYIQEAELYLTPDGILSLPFTIDPLVLYWNRDSFANASISTPPQYWDEFYDLSDKLTVKDSKLAISKSAIAMGEYDNVTHAKEILAALFLQAGTPITLRQADGTVSAALTQLGANSYLAGEAALTFYTQFANPVKSFYSWNSSLPNSKDMFLSGDLATYVGFASEYSDLKQKNPNLNFDVTYLPQARDAANKTTYGNLLGFAILKVSPSITDAFTTVYNLTSKENLAAWSQASTLPPVRRDLLSDIPTDSLGSIFYNSALWSRSWLDPNPTESSATFKEMIANVGSGKSNISDAVRTAQSELSSYIP